ncbi:FHA domain-containing protein [Streptomyces sp. NBC_00385]|uniref:FHA domain-containing protein n=1 Tax=Streptomyces sp. NBC_00385 TaxID=2975733 RepID=UPI002DDAEB82|nr:FHA domain-containing protein [Streptomyces sp. NBC_00385]WRZ04516.1 FHA domain-containing protein [Streptomyces sp. NBC_00385]
MAVASEQLVCRSCFVPYGLVGVRERGPGPGATRREAGIAAASPQGIRLEFDGGTVEVVAGEQVVLGRGAGDDPRLEFLSDETRFDHLSWTHATVRVDPEGAAWVRDENSMNHTYLGERALAPGQWQPLRVGDPLRLASDVRVRVRGLRA